MNQKLSEMIKNQILKATEKLKAAETLLAKGYYDDSISRAYYAIFHAASALLLAEGITVESHSALKTMFGLRFIKTGRIDKKYGKYLSRLKDERENGDYDIFTTFDKSDAQQAIKETEEFIDAMKELLAKSYNVEL